MLIIEFTEKILFSTIFYFERCTSQTMWHLGCTLHLAFWYSATRPGPVQVKKVQNIFFKTFREANRWLDLKPDLQRIFRDILYLPEIYIFVISEKKYVYKFPRTNRDKHL